MVAWLDRGRKREGKKEKLAMLEKKKAKVNGGRKGERKEQIDRWERTRKEGRHYQS